MKAKRCFIILFVIGVSFPARAKPVTPDYSNVKSQEGVCEIPDSRHEEHVFDRIEQEVRVCKGVIVKFLQRPLEKDVKGGLQKVSGGTVAHVQIVAYDKATGREIDNWGLTGDFLNVKQAQIFSEKSLDLYDKTPLGIVEMSSECYEATKARTVTQLTDSYYAPYNSVDVKSRVAKGAAIGGVTAGVSGALAGAGAGFMSATSDYDRNARRDYMKVDEPERQMSFAGMNCQSAADQFIKNAEGDPSFKVIEKYRQPGEKISDETKHTENDNSQGSAVAIDTSKIESLMKARIRMLEAMIATVEAGGRPSEQDIEMHNECTSKGVQEMIRLNDEILALKVSEARKQQISAQVANRYAAG